MQTFVYGQFQFIYFVGVQAFLIENDKEHVDFVGNRTECALLMMLRKWEVSSEYAACCMQLIGLLPNLCASPLALSVCCASQCPVSFADELQSTADRARAACHQPVWLLVSKEDGFGAGQNR